MKSAITLLIILLLIVAAFFFLRFLVARGMRKVVAIFREHKAVNPKGAATLPELGLVARRGMMGTSMFRPRDYKQTGMRIMAQEGVIKMTADERFYIDEKALAASRTKKFAHIK
jgi:hypothetical protein